MKTFFTLLTLGLTVFVSLPALADFPIRQSSNGDDQPAVAYNSNDNRYLVVWNELIPLGQFYMIGPVMGQLITEGGALVGNAFQIFSNGVGPSVAYNSQTNEYLVTTTWAGIKGQRVSNLGALVGNPVQLMDNASNSRILYNSVAGNYLLAGADLVENPPGSGYFNIKIFTRKIGADGQPLGSTLQVEDTPSGYQPQEARYALAYAPLQSSETPSGRYLLATQTNIGVSLTMLNSEGVPMYIVHDPAHPGIDYRYIPFKTGTATGGEFYVDVAYGTQSGYSMFGPAFLVVWGDNNNTWQGQEWTGIWGGFVDAQKLSYLTTDPVQDNSFPISAIYKHWAYSSYAETWKPVAAYNPIAEKYMVAWRETPGSEPENDTKVNHIRANKAFVQIPPPTNVVLSATSGNEDPKNPAIAASTYSSNALVVWMDHRNSASTNWDIYGSLYTILPAVSITILAPNGGELWPVNTQQEIKWTSTNFTDPVRISVSYAGYSPQFWQIITQSTPNDGSFMWTVPNNTSGDCVIRVADAADGDPYDLSDAPFSIVVPYGTESITVSSPNGNENWQVGSQQEIKWTSANLANPVRIEYSTTGGASYTTIVASTPNTGSYFWTIPNTPSTLCAVKILDAVDGDPWDINDAVFTISPAGAVESITVVSPNGNENWGVGSQQEIKWTSANLTNWVRIEYSTTGGASYIPIVASTANDGSYLWTIPDTPSSLCAVKISDAVDGDPWDISDAVFTIVPAAYPWMLVNNTQDFDPGSLRQAILDANAHAGPDTIRFDIPTYDPGFNAGMGVWTIKPQSQLPSISDAGTFIDGTSQSGYPGLNPNGPEIEIDGSQAGAQANGLTMLSSNNQIGGLVINRFAGSGIVIAGLIHDNWIVGNYIGVNPTAAAVAPNQEAGIWIEGASNNFIGYADTSLKYVNFIGGNQGPGIGIFGVDATGNHIAVNYIGTDRAHTRKLGNQGDGILIAGGANHTLITSIGFVSGLAIRYNAGAGLHIVGNGTVSNGIYEGSITGNGGPGILLEQGGNNDMPAPIINTADSLHVAGAAPPNSWVQIYADEGDEGAVWLGSTFTDPVGSFDWSGSVVGPYVTATATDTSGGLPGNTSMFSAPFLLAGAGHIRLVTNTDDSGPGSLRQAILDANAHAGNDTIYFAIPTSDPGFNADLGVWTIRPQSPLPELSEGGTVIDGIGHTVYPGANPYGPEIEIDGSQAGTLAHGLVITSVYNVISGLVINHFAGSGIVIAGAQSGRNIISANYIGVDPRAESKAPNGGAGIWIGDASENIIGFDPSTANVIGGNKGAGVAIQGTHARANDLMVNFIGTDSTRSRNLGNEGDGIFIGGGADSTRIEPVWTGPPWVPHHWAVHHNGGAGIRISGSGTLKNAIYGGSITDNGGPGILLEAGGNDNMPSPNILEADSAHVAGTAPPNSWVQVYADPGDEGATWLGGTYADPVGNFNFSGKIIGPYLTATASDTGFLGFNNTSMFSAPFSLAGVAYVRIVTNTNDSGPGSLREALTAAASSPGPDTVRFNIPTTDPGYNPATDVWTIKPATGYDVPSGTIVDGTITTALDREGNSPKPGIEIDGTTLGQLGVTGLWLYDGVTLRGLVVNRCQYGIWIASANVTVEDCYVGTDPTGSSARPNGIDGILVANGATNVVIQNNLFSGNSGSGIRLFGDTTTGNTLRNNRVGTNAAGTAALPNGNDGIQLHAGAHNNIVEQNLVSGNNGIGIHLLDAGTNGNVLRNNRIGTDAGGTAALPNGTFGVAFSYGPRNNVVGPGNIIAYNSLDGVLVDGADSFTSTVGNSITNNSITANGRKGIFNFRGGNAELSPPTILVVTPTQVSGTAAAGHTIEVFTDEDGQGRLYLGSTTADPSGNFVLMLATPPALPLVTATATDAMGNTSEFSAPIATEVETTKAQQVPKEFVLHSNYPNPFNPETMIRYELPHRSHVLLRITDLLGQEVVTLVDREQSPGYYSVSWDGSDRNGRTVASGIYVCNLRAHGFVQSRKLALIR